MPRHRIPFRYGGTEDDASINLAFSKKKIEERKEWLTNYMEERKRRAEMGLPEVFFKFRWILSVTVGITSNPNRSCSLEWVVEKST